MSNGAKRADQANKSLGDVVSDVSQKASLLVREEIELAKAEVTDKVSKLAKGAAVAAVAGVFLFFALIMLLHGLAWIINDAFDWSNLVWPGFFIVMLLLVLLAAIAGFLALRFFKKGSPPTPDMAIEEAKLTRSQLERQKGSSDKVERSLERGEEVKV